MKILVITPQYAPDYGPSAPIYTALCEDLQKAGCDVTVITAFPNYAGSDGTSGRHGKFFEEEFLNGVRIIRTFIYSVPKSSLWRRLLYHGSFNLFSWLASWRAKNPDAIIADGPSLWSGLPVLLRAIIPGIPFVYVVHDIYPDVLERLGVLHNRRILHLIDRVERFYYARSSKVSVLSEGFRENLMKKDVPKDKIAIIPACVDVDFIQPLTRPSRFRKLWGLQDKFVVLYAGNIGFSQGLEVTLQAAQRLRDCPAITFVLSGAGATKESLQMMARDMGLTNVRFFAFQPREDVPEIYGLADVSLVSLKGDIVVESVPSKTYTIMSSGRPIVATVDQNSEVGRLLKVADCGLCVPFGDPEALARAVRTLYGDCSLRERMGQNGRAHAVEYYSRQRAAALYGDVLKGVRDGR
jgi:colanic acid biosynthesis glycosyl transferase WcaI